MKKNFIQKIDGRFWLTNDGEGHVGRGRVELLKHIQETGSISQAAKAMKMSYKAAWDSVDCVNNMFGEVLVERISGGRHGGGSKLTDAGIKFVEQYEKYTKMFESFLTYMDNNPDGSLLINDLDLKSSADNIFNCIVKNIESGAVMSSVELDCNGIIVKSKVSQSSIERLNLSVGDSVTAMINSVDLSLGINDGSVSLSYDNSFKGSIYTIKKGAVNSEVLIKVEGLKHYLVVIILNESVDLLDIKYGSEVEAYCMASSVVFIGQ